MSGIRRFAVNTGVQFGAALLSSIFAFIFTYFAARNLNTATFGQLSVVQIFVTPFITLTDLGLMNVIVREIAQQKKPLPIISSNIIALKIVIGILTFFLVIATSYILSYKNDTLKLISLFAISVIPYSIISACVSIFNGTEKMVYSAIPVFIGNILGYAGSIIALALDYDIRLVFIILVTCTFIASFISLAVVYFRFTKFNFKINTRLCLGYLRTAIPFGMIMIINLIGVSTGPILLSRFRGEIDAGNFNIAYKIINVFFLFIGAYNAAIYPVFSRLGYTSKDKLSLSLSLSLKIMMIIGLTIIAVLTTLSDKMIQLVFPKYSMSVPALLVLAWFLFFSLLATITLNILYAERREREVVYIMTASTLASLLVTICLLPSLGLIGVCVGLVTLTAFQFFLSYIKIQKSYSLNPRKLLLQAVVFALPLALLGIVLHELHILLTITIIMVLILIEIRVFHLFTEDELIILFDVPILARFLEFAKSDKSK